MNGFRVTATTSLVALLALPSGPAAAQRTDAPILDEFTAYTIDGRELKLGILAFEYGITDRLTIGTDPPMWAARAVGDVLVPNLHLKLNLLAHQRLSLSVQAGVYYADLTGTVERVSGSVWLVPLTAWVSVPLTRKWSIHGEGTYSFVNATGTGDVDRADIEGAVTTEAVQVGGMLEYRVIPRLALTVRGRYQPWLKPLQITGSAQFDPFTRADLEAELRPKHSHPYAAVASVSYLGPILNARLGVGYGSIFVPGSNLYAPYTGVIPDASLAVRF